MTADDAAAEKRRREYEARLVPETHYDADAFWQSAFGRSLCRLGGERECAAVRRQGTVLDRLCGQWHETYPRIADELDPSDAYTFCVDLERTAAENVERMQRALIEDRGVARDTFDPCQGRAYTTIAFNGGHPLVHYAIYSSKRDF